MVLAIANKGAEFIYRLSTAHKVSKASAKKICDALNEHCYKVDNKNTVWHVYEDLGYPYDDEITLGFYVRNGKIGEKYI